MYVPAHVGLVLCRGGEKGVGRRRSRVVHVVVVVGVYGSVGSELANPGDGERVVREMFAVTRGQTRDERGDSKMKGKQVFLSLL